MDTPCELSARAARIDEKYRDFGHAVLIEVVDYADTLTAQFEAIDALLLRQSYYGRRRAA